MTDKIVAEDKLLVDLGDGTFAEKVVAVNPDGTPIVATASIGGDVTIDNGDAITGESLETGGTETLGWLSSLRKAITDRFGLLGQSDMAGSAPVVVASDQSAIPVDASGAAVPVTDNGGALTVDDGGGSITVDGPLTDTQLRTTAVPVSSTTLASAAKQDTLAGLVGEVTASPTTNTLLDRLKSIYTALTGGSSSPVYVRQADLDRTVDGVGADLKIAGTDVATNSGNKNAQTIRTVMATDQPSNTNNLNVNLATALSGLIDSIDTEGKKATYTVFFALSSYAASPTNVAILVGSASKTIRVRRIARAVRATAAATWLVQVWKQSTDDSGGTATNPALLSHDSGNSAATAVARQYSANPTVGTQVAQIDLSALQVPAAGGGAMNGLYVTNFADQGAGSLVLRGTSECLAFTLGGVTPPSGGILGILVTFTEE